MKYYKRLKNEYAFLLGEEGKDCRSGTGIGMFDSVAKGDT
jgi:hypothetical protein